MVFVGLHDAGLSEKLETDLDNTITMAQQTEAMREQQLVARVNTDMSHTQHLKQWTTVTPAKSKLLSTIQQRNKQNLFIFSKLPKQVRKDEPDVASSCNQCPACKAKCHKCGK